MKIQKVVIRNYRSCLDTEFTPHESLSVLIGPNGSGKTNVLSAIRLLPALCLSRPRHQTEEMSTGAPCEIRITYEIEDHVVTHVARLIIVTNERNQDEIIGSDEYWVMPSVTGDRKRVTVPSAFLYELAFPRLGSQSQSRARQRYFMNFLESRGITATALPLLEKVVHFISKISYYSASQFTNPGSSPLSFEVESENQRRTGISITGHKRFLFDIYQESRQKTEIYQQFIDLVGPKGIGLVEAVNFNEIQTSSSNYSVMTGGKFVMREKKNLLVIPSFQIAGNNLSPSQLSEGTFKTLALVFYLVTDKSSILMIEEPEVCVHHGLLSSIVELIEIYSKEKQIFISTHSDSVLDKVSIDNVFKVKRSTVAGTAVSSIRKNMKAKEMTALKQYLRDEGSLGEYWKHGDLENV